MEAIFPFPQLNIQGGAIESECQVNVALAELQSGLYISILYNSISSLLALPTLAQVWDYGQNSI